MKRKLIALVIILSWINISAQENNIKLPEFQVPGKPGYFITAEMQKGNVFKYKIRKDKSDKKTEFTVNPNTLECFTDNFIQNFNNTFSEKLDKEDDTKLIKETFNMFIVTSIAITTYDFEPDAGELCFNKEIKIYRYRIDKIENQIDYFFDNLRDTLEINDSVKIIRYINKRNRRLKNRYCFAKPETNKKKLTYRKIKREIKSDNNNVSNKIIRKKLLKKDFEGILMFEYDEERDTIENIKIRKGFFLKKKYTRTKWSSYVCLLQAKKRLKYDILDGLNKKFTDKFSLIIKEKRKAEKKYNKQKNILDSYDTKKDAVENKIESTESEINSLTDKISDEFGNLSEEVFNNCCLNDIKKLKNETDTNECNSFIEKKCIELIANTTIYSKAIDKIKYKKNDTLALFDIDSIIGHIIHLLLADSINKNVKLITYKNPYCNKINNETISLNSTKIDSIYNNNSLIDFINANSIFSKELRKNFVEKKDIIKEDIKIFNNILLLFESLKDSIINKINLTSYKECIEEKINKKNPILDSLKNILNKAKKDSIDAYNKIIYIKADVERIQVEFHNGFIENITVLCKVQDEYAVNKSGILKFENKHPIGFTRKLDFQVIKRKSLFSGDRKEGAVFELKMRDLLSKDYLQEHVTDRRDYSPKNGVINFFDTNNLCEKLKKEKTSNLFDVKVFSDLTGFKQENPNGILQTEISRKVLLYTNRINLDNDAGTNISWLAYIYPEFIYSKFEENNKRLILNKKNEMINNQYLPISYASTLDFRNHETFNIGFDLNLFLLDVPDLASTIFIDFGFRYGRTELQDSIMSYTNNAFQITGFVNEYGVNTYRFYPKITWEIKGDERFSTKLLWKLNHFYVRENENKVIQVANKDLYDETGDIGVNDKNKLYITASMLFRFKQDVTKKSFFFLRYSFNYQLRYWNTNFHQFQLGYSMHIKDLIK
ncbi:MAG: hypothetical protein K8R54_18700 [Bacteroidales bacterium]|nr:hypothetical protein [Bacteroidales bacterium]